jgi:hypothetical protein
LKKIWKSLGKKKEYLEEEEESFRIYFVEVNLIVGAFVVQLSRILAGIDF